MIEKMIGKQSTYFSFQFHLNADSSEGKYKHYKCKLLSILSTDLKTRTQLTFKKENFQ